MAYNSTSWTTNGSSSTVNSENLSYIRYKTFGLYDFSPISSIWHPLICSPVMKSDASADFSTVNTTFGSEDNPDTSIDMSSKNPSMLLPCIWFIQDDIEILNAKVFATCDNSTDKQQNFRIMKYDMDNIGDLSNGIIIGDGSLETNTGKIVSTDLNITTSNSKISSSTSSTQPVVVVLGEQIATGSPDITYSMSIKYGVL